MKLISFAEHIDVLHQEIVEGVEFVVVEQLLKVAFHLLKVLCGVA